MWPNFVCVKPLHTFVYVMLQQQTAVYFTRHTVVMCLCKHFCFLASTAHSLTWCVTSNQQHIYKLSNPTCNVHTLSDLGYVTSVSTGLISFPLSEFQLLASSDSHKRCASAGADYDQHVVKLDKHKGRDYTSILWRYPSVLSGDCTLTSPPHRLCLPHSLRRRALSAPSTVPYQKKWRGSLGSISTATAPCSFPPL